MRIIAGDLCHLQWQFHYLLMGADEEERLEREYDLQLITTAPTVIYQCVTADGQELMVNSPADLPDVSAWFFMALDRRLLA
eukprot:scaffold64960_cov17-Tisochrysis_lutea.AAC.2